MTIPRKGTRQITVDGISYRWLVSPDDEPGLGIIVERAEFPANKVGALVEHGTIISPGLVRKVILHALSKGWQPQKSGQGMGFRFEEIISKYPDDTESPLLLRNYQKEDDRSIWHLYNLGLERVGVRRGEGKWDDDLRNIPSFYQESKGAFIVGCLGKQAIAMGAFKYVSEQEAEIRRIYVDPDFQRLGYGQQLLEYLESQAVKSGYKLLTLHTNSIQVAAQGLYVRNGYIEIKRQSWRGIERIYFEKRFL
ncbi:MAG: GNAT family N-acetyltransferase [Cyanosarcina radialis HA8281-LM2]|jgi:ribosomal protein S18 acetylase RimI-like enzyme|nr:GNAT family N-acetyltransferase [Cyanosarcina radialis HA8281-LM2]